MGFLRRAHLRNREVVIKLNVVQQSTRDEVRGAAASVRLRVDHVVRANTLQNLAVRGGDSLRPDTLHANVYEVRGNQHGRLHGGAHTHHSGAELVRTQLVQGVDIGRIGGDHVGQHARPFLHQLGVLLDGENLLILQAQLGSHSRTEASQADDEDGGVMCTSQWWAFLRGTCRGGGVNALPSRLRRLLYPHDQ